MPEELAWKKAIVKVLEEAEEPLHYTDIAEHIIDQGLRSKAGATPWQSVAGAISKSMKKEGSRSPFERPERGYYTLKAKTVSEHISEADESHGPSIAEADSNGRTVSAFGVYWRRDGVKWPHLYGQQGAKGDRVDLGKQCGIYLLYDALGVVYVGKAQSIATRLSAHRFDRLAARWQYFSWFGLRPVREDGTLGDAEGSASASGLINGMEAILIEAMEPRLNRQGGRDMDGREYIQVRNPRV